MFRKKRSYKKSSSFTSYEGKKVVKVCNIDIVNFRGFNSSNIVKNKKHLVLSQINTQPNCYCKQKMGENHKISWLVTFHVVLHAAQKICDFFLLLLE